MGYYTDFDLEVIPAPEAEDDLDFSLTDYTTYRFDRYADGKYFLHSKWYSHNDDMRVLSSEFPEYLFKLKGRGEEFDDIWVEFYRGGLFYRVDVLVIPQFDESRLADG